MIRSTDPAAKRSLETRRLILSITFSWLLAAASPAAHSQASQTRDDSFESQVRRPTYDAERAPRVVIDEHHCNFHTAGERYKPFAELLRLDGLVVEPLNAAFSAEALSGADVLVIANALGEAQCEEWKLPTASAFGDEEIEALASWVEAGGALLLIADHMPFPGANEKLASTFGLAFTDGYVQPDSGGPWIRFDHASGTLADHPVTSGRSDEEAIHYVTSFTGQGFRAVSNSVTPLLVHPAGTTNLLPSEAGQFDDATPRFSAEGLLQGALVSHGKGRVAVFGEAAMFSAQEIERGGETFKFGMNADGAEHNAQFLLNVLHWLTGILEPAGGKP